ncbi:MAG: HAD-IA family hydrolase [Elusimicrobia bacterium]|nr:HAD-IA family hydrolase [Elusimicrobiota bacterium]
MIKAVIFDIDNTLTDFMKMKRAAVDSAVEGMIDAGLKVEKTAMVEKIFDLYWNEGVEDQKIFDKVLAKEFGGIDYKVLAAAIIGYRRAKAGTMALYPHVGLTLAELMKMGIRIVVVSDAPRLEVWLRIVSLGLQHSFDRVITSEDTGFKKPNPAPFRKALEALGTKPRETLMVGDWAERDMAGARALGIRTAWAKYGDTFDTKEAGAEFELDDISQLVGIIRSENAGKPRRAKAAASR